TFKVYSKILIKISFLINDYKNRIMEFEMEREMFLKDIDEIKIQKSNLKKQLANAVHKEKKCLRAIDKVKHELDKVRYESVRVRHELDKKNGKVRWIYVGKNWNDDLVVKKIEGQKQIIERFFTDE
ncbi:hypothetical protein MHK_004693, partial [Candidatus Magnetomorum sp. HK-1]